ncbi:MAG: hypothetical protein KC583_20355 [Myxococcales bacterium]|nr:hypothetical protein [Myxococcales bacterium]
MAQTPTEGFYAAGLMVAATCLMAGALFPGESFAIVFAQVLLGAGAVACFVGLVGSMRRGERFEVRTYWGGLGGGVGGWELSTPVVFLGGLILFAALLLAVVRMQAGYSTDPPTAASPVQGPP